MDAERLSAWLAAAPVGRGQYAARALARREPRTFNFDLPAFVSGNAAIPQGSIIPFPIHFASTYVNMNFIFKFKKIQFNAIN